MYKICFTGTSTSLQSIILLKPAGTKSFNYTHVAITFKSFRIYLFNKHCLGAQDMPGSVKYVALPPGCTHTGVKNRLFGAEESTEIKPSPTHELPGGAPNPPYEQSRKASLKR